MAITIMKFDGSTEVIEPSPGTCRDALVEKGIYTGPPASLKVLCEQDDVSDQPLQNFDGKKLIMSPKEEKGGNR